MQANVKLVMHRLNLIYSVRLAYITRQSTWVWMNCRGRMNTSIHSQGELKPTCKHSSSYITHTGGFTAIEWDLCIHSSTLILLLLGLCMYVHSSLSAYGCKLQFLWWKFIITESDCTHCQKHLYTLHWNTHIWLTGTCYSSILRMGTGTSRVIVVVGTFSQVLLCPCTPHIAVPDWTIAGSKDSRPRSSYCNQVP